MKTNNRYECSYDDNGIKLKAYLYPDSGMWLEASGEAEIDYKQYNFNKLSINGLVMAIKAIIKKSEDLDYEIKVEDVLKVSGKVNSKADLSFLSYFGVELPKEMSVENIIKELKKYGVKCEKD